MLDGSNPHTPRGCTVKSKPGNYPIFIFLLTSIILTSCGGGGGGDINDNVSPLSNILLVSNTNFEAVEVFSADVPVINHTLFNLTGKDGVVTVTGISGATSVQTIDGIVTLDTINNDVTVPNVGGNIILRNIIGSALIDLVRCRNPRP